jgi:lipopolysaccharide/colanic/teichoic acid biosynthesis glycosyltransferase
MANHRISPMTRVDVRVSDLIARNTAVLIWRVLDPIIATAGFVVFGPIMMLISLAIWICDGRPIIFSQVRLGQSGRHFRMYKFRKFHNQTSGCGVTVEGDHRLTRFGAVLARTKLDELPQLWNVLKGDMSIVGPRPESLTFSDCLTNSHLRVLDHKPGLFGPNQFYFRAEYSLYPNNDDPEQFYREVLFPLKAHIDIAYFPNRTFLEDTRWIIRCVLPLFGIPPLRARLDEILTGWLDFQEQKVPASPQNHVEVHHQFPEVTYPVGGSVSTRIYRKAANE